MEKILWITSNDYLFPKPDEHYQNVQLQNKTAIDALDQQRLNNTMKEIFFFDKLNARREA